MLSHTLDLRVKVVNEEKMQQDFPRVIRMLMDELEQLTAQRKNTMQLRENPLV